LKRSNRLILLVGVVLAAVAFVAIVFLFSGNSGPSQPAQVTDADTVIAAVDIPLGTQVRADMLTTHKVLLENRATDAYGEPSLVVGQIARANIVANAQITKSMFATLGVGTAPGPLLAKGLRAQSIQVDQVTGVGTLINVGDRVDAVVGFGGGGCGASFPVVTVDPTTDTVTPVAGLSSITVKMLLQNMQVVSTLLPPPSTSNGQPQESPSAGGGTTLNGQQEIVVLAVTAQQSEVIKYAQTDGCISLVLRSPKDYVDDSGNATEPGLDPTSGIILKTLVDEYGVLPPQVVEAILPKK
jgi:Flp pilus assembly protein CpaB